MDMRTGYQDTDETNEEGADQKCEEKYGQKAPSK